VARANVAVAKANLDRAKINLAYSVISSPTDGTVISRNVDVGQTVAASLQAPTLFTIAQDLRLMQIEADIDEADIGGLQEGMAATFTVDAFPDETFHGKIQQIRYNASTTQGVVTYPVMVSVSNPDLKLRPGMTANVSIISAQRDDVLRVPAIAVRFRPPDAPAQSDRAKGGSDTSRVASQTGQSGGGASGSHRGGGQGGGQRQGHDSTAAQGTDPAPHVRHATLWVKGSDGKPQARKVAIGLNDGNHVEIVSGDLAAGDSVIVGMIGATATNGSASSSRMPGFGGTGGPGGGRR
jgi:HlyD family secretion protein